MAVYYNIRSFALVCFAHDNLQSLVPQNIYVHTQLVMFVVQVGSRRMGVEGGQALHISMSKIIKCPMHIQHYRPIQCWLFRRLIVLSCKHFCFKHQIGKIVGQERDRWPENFRKPVKLSWRDLSLAMLTTDTFLLVTLFLLLTLSLLVTLFSAQFKHNSLWEFG